MPSPLLNGLVRESFKRLPTAAEWTCFRKYARRMRELRGRGGALETLSPEVSSVMQLHAANEPLLPNLTTLDLWGVSEPLVSLIPLLLTPTITSISLGSIAYHLPRSVIASVIANLPTSCPNLQDISLPLLSRDPMITAAVSEMFFATNRNILRRFHVDSPLTEEAAEAVCKSHNLCSLSVVVEKGAPIPSVSLPKLIRLQIECEDGGDGLQLLRGATFGKLESIDFTVETSLTDDFLETFKVAALSSSIQNTLSAIYLFTEWSWNPNYSSLLPFTRLVDLKIIFPCDDDCLGADDDILVDLSRVMPKLESLCLGDWPCHQLTGGATAKGLTALARNCLNLSSLRVHFRAASLIDPPTDPETTLNVGYSALWAGCALTKLEVGGIPVPEGSASMVALALLRIFPRIETIDFMDTAWSEVEDMVFLSKLLDDCSSKYHHLTVLRNSSLTLLWSRSRDRQSSERGIIGSAHNRFASLAQQGP